MKLSSLLTTVARITFVFWTGLVAQAQHPALSFPIQPPLSIPSPLEVSHPYSAAINSTSASETLIVEHQQPSILTHTVRTVGGAFLARPSSPSRAGSAQALIDTMNAQRRRIQTEQKEFRAKLLASGITGSNAAAPLVVPITNVLNASIIKAAPAGTLERLQSLGFKVTKALPIKVSLSESVPHIQADKVWSQVVDTSGRAITGLGITIGIIDTGIDYTHPSLGGCAREQFESGTCAKVVGGHDWVDDDNDPMDEHFHGTHVAGIAAGNGTLRGVAPDAHLFALRVLDADGFGSTADVIRAIEWSTDPNGDGDFSDRLDVINLSLGAPGGSPDSPDSLAADAATDAGVVVVVAAGNAGPDATTIGSPGASRKAITVGASDKADAIADFSSRGPVFSGGESIPKPDLVAPGVGICAAKLSTSQRRTCRDSAHTSLSGTSMATPHVTGVVALMKQARPDASPTLIKALLKDTSVKLRDESGASIALSAQGAGRVNALAATKAALTGETPPIASIQTSGEIYLSQTAIIGSAMGSGFDRYELFYRAESATEEKLITSSTTSITNGTLGFFDTSLLASGRYTLRLVVYTASGTAEDSVNVSLRHLAITDPVLPKEAEISQRMIQGQSDRISIHGRVNGDSLQKYTLEVCWNFSDTQGCSSQGVDTTSEGVTQVVDGELGTIDISALPTLRRGLYEIRLTAAYADRASETIAQGFYLNPNMLRGFHPDLICDNGSACGDIGSQPLVADINGDGAPEVIYTLSRHIHVVDKSGQDLPGWPRGVDQTLLTAPSVGDIDGDGKPEVVAQGFDVRSSTQALATVYAFHFDGTPVQGWPYRFDGDPATLQRYLGDFITVADINGDSAAEVVLSPTEVLDGQGNRLAGWPTELPDLPADQFRMFGGFAVQDLNNDGSKEIIWSATHWRDWVYTGGEHSVVVVQNSAGDVTLKRAIDGLIPTGPIIVDVNGDGAREIAAFARSNVRGTSEIYVLDISGNTLPGWPYRTSNLIFGDVVFTASIIGADINGDGRAEIITHSDIDTRVVYYENDTPVAKRPNDYRLSGFGALTAANVDMDAEPEIVFVSRYYPQRYPALEETLDPRTGLVMIVAINSDLTLVPGFPILAPRSGGRLYPLAIGDLDGDIQNEILYPTRQEIVAFRTGGCANPFETWPFSRGNAARSAEPFIAPMCEGGASLFPSCAIHSDDDLIDDCQDLCPTTSRLFPEGVCGCALESDDSDGDGTPDCIDECPSDPGKTTLGACGCGTREIDTDGDGAPDCKNIVQSEPKPTKKLSIKRRKNGRYSFILPRAIEGSSIRPNVEICIKRRSKTRCKLPRQNAVTFTLKPGGYAAYYALNYGDGRSDKSPYLRIRVPNRRTR